MSAVHHGGCLCGDARYEVSSPPLRVTVCHCKFCQRFTGTAFLVEPIFRKVDVALTGAALKTYDHRSDESQQRVTLNFCGRCATTLFLSFERFQTSWDSAPAPSTIRTGSSEARRHPATSSPARRNAASCSQPGRKSICNMRCAWMGRRIRRWC